MADHPPTLPADDVRLRDVIEGDLPIFFEHQCEPETSRTAAFPPRAREAFMAHWAKVRGDAGVTVKTILFGGRAAGNVICWERGGRRLVGYWIGREFWGRGVASRAIADFLGLVRARPLYAHVAKQNAASIRVLEKRGFAICADGSAPPDAMGDGVADSFS